MKKSVVIDKQIGETPLEALTVWKARHPLYENVPAAYAGRLDPMASGKLLILLGEECKKLKKYTGLDKAYDVEVLLGIGSDTGDILGVAEAGPAVTHISRSALMSALKAHVGTRVVPYPVFSSKTVAGKPLFLYALEQTIDTIEIPTHQEVIYNISLRSQQTIPTLALQERITSLLALAPTSAEPSKVLGADFRIAEVRRSWKQLFSSPTPGTYHVFTLHVSCASGTYMRTLAGSIGEALGTRGLALSIRRTRIGHSFFSLFSVV